MTNRQKEIRDMILSYLVIAVRTAMVAAFFYLLYALAYNSAMIIHQLDTLIQLALMGRT